MILADLRRILMVDRPEELDTMEAFDPRLRRCPVVFLSARFEVILNMQSSSREYHFFDENIDDDDAQQMIAVIHETLWTWFLDEDNRDISSVDGCSLGRAFAGSMEILFNTVLRYVYGLSKFLTADQMIYYTADTEPIFQIVAGWLQQKIGFGICPVGEKREVSPLLPQRIRPDAAGRWRDLRSFFHRKDLVNRFLAFLLSRFQLKKNAAERVLLVSAGKLEDYFHHLKHARRTESKIHFILPFARRDLITFHRNGTSFYKFCSTSGENNPRIEACINALKRNLKKRIQWIDGDVLTSIMECFVFHYFHGAFAYYGLMRDTLQKIAPRLLLLPSDVWETHILLAMAAKNIGIITAYIPHGLCGWGHAPHKAGPARLFDFCLAFGNKDMCDFRDHGVEETRIRVSAFPYFSRFLPVVQAKHRTYRKALLLPLDPNNVASGAHIKDGFQFVQDVVALLDDLQIELVGIKARGHSFFQRLGLEKNIWEYKGRCFPLLSGDESLPEAAKRADFVIGSLNTAVIECGLMGIDYYTYLPPQYYRGIPSVYQNFHEILNIADTPEALKNNILSRSPYRENRSVYDFIDMEGITTPEELYQRFENALSGILSTKSQSRIEHPSRAVN